MARLLFAAAVATDLKFLGATSVSCSSSWSVGDVVEADAANDPLSLVQLHKSGISGAGEGQGLWQRPDNARGGENGQGGRPKDDGEEEEDEEDDGENGGNNNNKKDGEKGPEDGNCSTHVAVYSGMSYANNITSFTWDVSCNGNSHAISHITFSNDTWVKSDTDGFIQVGNAWEIGKDGNFKWPVKSDTDGFIQVGNARGTGKPDSSGNQIYGLKKNQQINCNLPPEPLTVVLKGRYAPCEGQYKIKTSTQTIFCPSTVPCTPDLCKETSECKIWGDPHIIGFDSQVLDMSLFAAPTTELLSQSWGTMDGIYWLVKSERVVLQGRFAKLHYPKAKFNGTYMVGLAMSGPALEGNIVEVYPQDGQVFWNGQPILTVGGTQEFTHDDFVALRAFEAQDVNVDKAEQVVTSVEAQIGTCIKLLINRHSKHLNMRLTTPRDAIGAGPVGGQCGNFNGNAADDTADLISARSGGLQVEDQEEILFSKHEEV